MPTIPTISTGDPSSAANQYNLLVDAMAAIGITDTEQLFAIFTELRLKDANTWLKRSGSDLELRDAVTGAKNLKTLAGYSATPLTYGHSGSTDAVTSATSWLVPFRSKKTVTVMGVRVSNGGLTVGSSAAAIYDDASPSNLLAATSLIALQAYVDSTLPFGNPPLLIPGALYWLGLRVTADNSYIRRFQGRPNICLLPDFWTGFPMTLDRSGLATGNGNSSMPAGFQLIFSGGMTYE